MIKRKILIVDDDKNIRESLRSILEDEDFEVLEADNGLKAISVCRNNNIDFVLLDISIPSVDGLTALKEIKNIKKDIKVIVISAYSFPEIKARAIEYGAVQFFEKPISIEKLLNALN